jgi:hypothetical protein
METPKKIDCVARVINQAKKEGRVCKNCGWIITKVDWKKGERYCRSCRDALKGVNVKGGTWPESDDRPEHR